MGNPPVACFGGAIVIDNPPAVNARGDITSAGSFAGIPAQVTYGMDRNGTTGQFIVVCDYLNSIKLGATNVNLTRAVPTLWPQAPALAVQPLTGVLFPSLNTSVPGLFCEYVAASADRCRLMHTI